MHSVLTSDLDRAVRGNGASAPAIEVQNLSHAYGHVAVLRQVELAIRDGEFVTLLGPSGCGKTTLLQIVAGLIRPSEASVAVAGTVVVDRRRYVPPEKRGLSVVFQDYALWPHLTVRQHVEFPLAIRHDSRERITTRVDEVLRQVGLTNEADRQPRELSGGQQQRVAMARALAHVPTALLLDEPLSNLNASLRSQVREELVDLCKRTGVACLYVTHDQLEALAMSDRLAVMADGVIVQQGSPEAVFREPASAAVAHIVGCGEAIPGRWAGGAFVPANLAIRWHSRCNPAVADGDTAVLVVPPAHIHLDVEPRCANSAEVAVTRNTYQGDHYEVTCTLAGTHVIQARSPSALPYGPAF